MVKQGSAHPVTRSSGNFQKVRLAVWPECKSLLFIRSEGSGAVPKLAVPCYAMLARPHEMHAPRSPGCVKLKGHSMRVKRRSYRVVRCRVVSCLGVGDNNKMSFRCSKPGVLMTQT